MGPKIVEKATVEANTDFKAFSPNSKIEQDGVLVLNNRPPAELIIFAPQDTTTEVTGIPQRSFADYAGGGASPDFAGLLPNKTDPCPAPKEPVPPPVVPEQKEPEGEKSGIKWKTILGAVLIGVSGLLVFNKLPGLSRVFKHFMKKEHLNAQGLPNAIANAGWGLMTMDSLDVKNDPWWRTAMKLTGMGGLFFGARAAMLHRLSPKEAFLVNTIGWGPLLFESLTKTCPPSNCDEAEELKKRIQELETEKAKLQQQNPPEKPQPEKQKPEVPKKLPSEPQTLLASTQ